MKLSLYLPISIASSHSPTELKDGKAEKVLSERGMDMPWDLPMERVVKREWGTARQRGDRQVWQEGGHLGHMELGHVELGHVELGHFGGSRLCTNLLRTLWICENLGRWLRSFCQQLSIS